ncbi:MAG: response regulator transcription factor, partial [Planctomycetota bacterium]
SCRLSTYRLPCPQLHIVSAYEEQGRRYVDSLQDLIDAGVEIRQYESAAEFMAVYAGQRPVAVVCDAVMTDISGIDLVILLRKYDCDVPVVLGFDSNAVDVFHRAVVSGANGYVDRQQPGARAPQFLTQLLINDNLRCESQERRAWVRFRLRDLTPHDWTLIRYTVEGMTMEQIAAKMGISDPRTCFRDKKRLRQQIYCTRWVEFIHTVADAGLLENRPKNHRPILL